MESILSYIKKDHAQNIDRVRRSYRSMLCDVYSKILLEGNRERASGFQQVRKAHQEKLALMQRELFQIKKSCRSVADEISKNRTQVSRFQLMIKKNNLADLEIFNVNEEKIRADNLIDYFYQAITTREEKIKELSFDIQILEIATNAMDTGMSILSLPSYLISGEDFAELKKKKAAMNSKYAGTNDPIRLVDGVPVSVNEDHETLVEILEEIMQQVEDEASWALEEKENEVEEINAKYIERYEKLLQKQKAKQKKKLKTKLAKHWDQQRKSATHNLLQETCELRKRIQKEFKDKAVFSDLNGPCGV